MVEQVKTLIEEGFSVGKTAEELNLEFRAVKKIVRENNFEIKKEPFSEDLIPLIISLYQKGISAKNLAIRFSIDKRRVQRWVREKGLERKSRLKKIKSKPLIKSEEPIELEDKISLEKPKERSDYVIKSKPQELNNSFIFPSLSLDGFKRTFSNKYSFRCLLGPRSDNVLNLDDLFFWSVNGKRHMSCDGPLDHKSLYIIKEELFKYGAISFHYINEYNSELLNVNFKIKKSRGISVCVKPTVNLSGKKFSKLRHSINKCKNLGLSLEKSLRKTEDIDLMIKEWSDHYSGKYFRDHSGKHRFFYQSNFHKDCINIFIYDGEDLVAFGSLSPPAEGYCSYILGKALYKRHPGLSEYADYQLYLLGLEAGCAIVDMGDSKRAGINFYKKKFPGAVESIYYDGKIEI